MKRFLLIVSLLMTACAPERPEAASRPVAIAPSAGNAETGKQLIETYACLSCHQIPGFEGQQQGSLAPSLERYALREAISGRVPNNPQMMSLFLQNPQAVDP